MGRHWRRHVSTRSCAMGTVARGWWRSPARSKADGPRKPRISCGVWQVRRPLVFPEGFAGAHEQRGADAGVVFWLFPRRSQSLRLCWEWEGRLGTRCHPSMRCWRTLGTRCSVIVHVCWIVWRIFVFVPCLKKKNEKTDAQNETRISLPARAALHGHPI